MSTILTLKRFVRNWRRRYDCEDVSTLFVHQLPYGLQPESERIIARRRAEERAEGEQTSRSLDISRFFAEYDGDGDISEVWPAPVRRTQIGRDEDRRSGASFGLAESVPDSPASGWEDPIFGAPTSEMSETPSQRREQQDRVFGWWGR
jgi:hypothetical protein